MISVLGILASSLIALIDPVAQMKKSRDSKAKTQIREIQSALEIYRADCGAYPVAASNAIPSPLRGCPGVNNTTYIQSVPLNPRGNAYHYENSPAGSSDNYTILYCLENKDAVVGDGVETVASSSCTDLKAYRATNP